MPSRPDDPTEAIPQVPDDTARMPPAAEADGSPPEVETPATVASSTQAAPAGDAPLWAAAGHAPDEAAGAPRAATASTTSWWKGRAALAVAALVTGLGLGAAAGATAVVAIDRGDHVAQVGESDRGGFTGEGRPPGGRHGGGELPDGAGQLPGGGQGVLPGGGTSTDPGDANGTDQAT